MLGYKQAKAQLIDPKVRFYRFLFAFFSGFLLFGVLNYLFDIKMIIVAYIFYPLLVVLALRWLLSPRKHIVKAVDLPHASQLQAIKDFLILTCLLLFFTLNFSWIPAFFISATHQLPTESMNHDLLTMVVNYYYLALIIIPWPFMIFQMLLLNRFSQDFSLKSIDQLNHAIYKGKRKNDSLHNLMKTIYYSHYVFSFTLLYVTAIYSLYLLIVNNLGLYPIKGVTVFNLVFLLLTLFIVAHKTIRTVFRDLYSGQWSIEKKIVINSVILFLWLFIPTLLSNLFISENSNFIQGEYYYQSFELKYQFLFFVWCFWWYFFPVMGHFLQGLLIKHTKIKRLIISLFAFLVVFLLFRWQVSSTLFIGMFNILLQSANFKLLYIVICTIITTKYIIKNDVKFSYFRLDNISPKPREQQNKISGKMSYMLFFISLPMLMLLMIENFYMLGKFIAFFPFIQIGVLLVWSHGLIKLYKNGLEHR